MTESLPRRFGPYVLLARLGRGAAGAAYLARPLGPDRGVPSLFVLKLLHTELSDREEFVLRFRHEAEIAIAVHSPHVAAVFDVGNHGGTLYIALEYVAGWTVGRLLTGLKKSQAQAPLPVVHTIVTQHLRGLETLHEATDVEGRPLDAVHRDVSPKNLMVAEDGRSRVIDLGLMKSNLQSWQTTAGRIMGSPGYIAPEQVRGKPVDRRADLFAMGTIAHELITGRRYVEPGDSIDMLRKSLKMPFVPPSEARTGLPPGADDVLACAMAKDPDGRFSTAADMIAALGQVLPPPATEAEVQAFLQELIPEDYRYRRAEVARLATLPLDDEPEVEATMVFVRRPGVQPEPDGAQVEATRVVGAPLPALVEAAAPAEPRPPSAGMTSLRWSQSWSVNRRTPVVFGILLVIALGLGFAGGALFMRGDPRGTTAARVAPLAHPAPTPLVTPQAAAPRVMPETPSVTPEAPASQGVPEVVPPTAQAPVERPARTRARPVAPAAAPASAAPRLPQRAARLQAGVLALKDHLDRDDPRRAELDRLLTRLTMLKAGGFSARAEGQLATLEGQFAQLKAQVADE